MIRTVACTSCSTTFPVDPRKVPDEGVYARCSACAAVFFVEGVMAGAAAATVHSSQSFETEFPGVAAAVEAESTAMTPTDGAGAPATDDWVFETEPEIDPASISVERLDTVESAAPFVAPPPPPPVYEPEPIRATPPPPPPPPPVYEPEPILAAPPPPPPPAPAAPAAAAAAAPAAAAKPAAAPAKSFGFGKRDPHEKASRLARVLVSDIITYNPERHQRALDAGTLKQDFDDEIKKSWSEYVDQVGKEIAETTEYFNKALNEILARGQQLF
jgi:predicted Zn finger-like uncharacterized protein